MSVVDVQRLSIIGKRPNVKIKKINKEIVEVKMVEINVGKHWRQIPK